MLLTAQIPQDLPDPSPYLPVQHLATVLREDHDVILQSYLTWVSLCQSFMAVLLPPGAFLKEDCLMGCWTSLPNPLLREPGQLRKDVDTSDKKRSAINHAFINHGW
jgi:hypothetical protein